MVEHDRFLVLPKDVSAVREERASALYVTFMCLLVVWTHLGNEK